MGSRLVRFNFTPGENEQIETVIKVPEEKRSVIHGIVKDHKGRMIKDAVVKLFEVLDPHDKCSLKPITHTFTDDCGQFLFGPLIACRHYAIKVWINDVKIRELVIHPDDCPKPPYDNNHNKDDNYCTVNNCSSDNCKQQCDCDEHTDNCKDEDYDD